MSKYTTTIKNMLDNDYDLGLKEYPIFDENYRNTLNKKILYHYYEDEIAFETAGLFKFYLNNKLNEIMPYYNNLYNAEKELLKDTFSNFDFEETYNSIINGTNNTTNNGTSNTTDTINETSENTTNNTTTDKGTTSVDEDVAHHNTPQGIVNEQKIKDSKYLSSLDRRENATTNDNTNTLKGSSNTTNTGNNTSINTYNNDTQNTSENNQKYTRKIKGLQGKSKLEIYTEFKNNFANIDMMIINDLEELFFGLF